jgi:hypothetical protein
VILLIDLITPTRQNAREFQGNQKCRESALRSVEVGIRHDVNHDIDRLLEVELVLKLLTCSIEILVDCIGGSG